jgi:hypothetical protein
LGSGFVHVVRALRGSCQALPLAPLGVQGTGRCLPVGDGRGAQMHGGHSWVRVEGGGSGGVGAINDGATTSTRPTASDHDDFFDFDAGGDFIELGAILPRQNFLWTRRVFFFCSWRGSRDPHTRQWGACAYVDLLHACTPYLLETHYLHA